MIDAKLDRFILALSEFDYEPFHVLYGAVHSKHLVKDPAELIERLDFLVNAGYLSCSYHSGESGAKYEVMSGKIESELKTRIRQQLTEFPKKGGEYFFQATERAREILKSKDEDAIFE